MNIKRLSNNLLAGALLLATSVVSAENLSPVVITDLHQATDGSDNLVITGRVNSAAGVVNLDINGYPTATFDGEHFNLQMPPAQDYQIHLYSADGGYQVIDYAAPSAPVSSAVQVVVGDQLMQDMGPALGQLLTNLDINSVLGINPNTCVIDTWFLAGCDLYIKQLQLKGTPNIHMYFSQSSGEKLTVNVVMDIPQAVMSTKLKRAFWLGYIDTTVTTNDIHIAVQMGVQATANQSVKLVLDQPSDIQMQIGSMQVQSNSLAAYLLPLFKDTLTTFVNTSLVNITGPFLAHLPIPAIPLSLPIDIDGDSVADAKFAIKMSAEKLNVLPGNDGQAVLSGSISSEEVAPGREVLGSRRIASMLPGAEAVSPPTDITAAIATNLVNQVFTAVYQSGIDQKLVIPMTVADLGSFGSSISLFLGYSSSTPLAIRLKFGAPPELQVNGSSQYPLGVQMVLPNAQMVMSAVTARGEKVILDMNADFVVATSLGAEQTGQLHLEFTHLLAMQNTVINGGTFTQLYPPEMLAQLIPVVLPNVTKEYEPMINQLLNAPRLELDIGKMLSNWLHTTFPSVPVAGYVTEAGVSDDESYMQIGMGIDFP